MAEAGTVIGDEEIVRKLAHLNEKVQTKILQAAFDEAMMPIELAIYASLKRMAGRKTGNLESSIGHRVKRYSTSVFATVGPLWPLGAHGHLVEFGHDIVTGGTKINSGGRSAAASKRTGKRGQGRVGGRTREFPFEAAAWESIKHVALGEIERKISEGIQREADAL